MFNKFELIGGGVCVGLMALAIYMVQVQTAFDAIANPQTAATIDSGVVVVSESTQGQTVDATGAVETENNNDNSNRMVIDDIKEGEGKAVQKGDTVSVHYAGRLQDGTEFDNSKKRGAPLDFKVGGGQVIQGWEEGLVGMRVGGERVLVIPPEMAYGDQGIGPIPGGATLIFSLELVAIK